MALYPGNIFDFYSWYGNKHHPNDTREWFAEKITGRKNLLICIGDSWTWGDSLGKSYQEPLYNDVDARHNQFYTNLLAEHLEADWMMIAWCGGTNNWILHQYDTIKEAIDKGSYKDYDKVYVHVCFTELFRDLRDAPTFIPNRENFKEFTEGYFKAFVIDRLEKYSPIPDTHKFSKNFWNVDLDVSKYNFIEKTWQDVMFEQSGMEQSKFIPVVSGIGIDPLTTFLKNNDLKDLEVEFSELLVDVDELVEKMIKCEYNNEHATKHPTADGHRLWADYLAKFYLT
tara:strand:- start:8852 stop:9703 length:852 start_codon:yes stop_codon:yes gene_type:complete